MKIIDLEYGVAQDKENENETNWHLAAGNIQTSYAEIQNASLWLKTGAGEKMEASGTIKSLDISLSTGMKFVLGGFFLGAVSKKAGHLE